MSDDSLASGHPTRTVGTHDVEPATTASPWGLAAALAVLLSAVLTVLLVAFAWPATRSSLHDIPLAVAGPAPAVAQVSAMLEQRRPGAFDIRAVPDETAALTAIRGREVYGAIVLGNPAPTVLMASAASPAVAQGLAQLAQALGTEQPSAAGPTVRDVVALPAEDPRGAGLAAGAFPLVIGGIATAALLTLRLRGSSRRLAAACGVWVLGALAMTGVLHGWLGALAGSFWANAGVVALSLAATSLTLLGLEWLLGLPGLGLGAAVMLLLGNPLSGLTSAPEMLPQGWGALGQLLPPGASGSLLRSVAFFDGAGAGRPLTVLLAWLAVGAVLATAGTVRTRRIAAQA